MSLVGNLEDLGLAELLQIVSLSHKSGTLQLSSHGRAGTIYFRDGLVIRATASTCPEHLGDLLLRGGLIDVATLRQALLLQQTTSGGRRLGEILAREFGLKHSAIDDLVRDHIERLICGFFAWESGDFALDLGVPAEVAATDLDPLQFMLDSGLNPHWLAMEGSRRHAGLHRGDNVPLGPGMPLVAGPRSSAGDAVPVPTGPSIDIAAELLHELGEGSGVSPQPIRHSPGLPLLRCMLEELHDPALGGGIILLILRFASELMNRAVIFLIKGEELVGIGQFGIDIPGEAADVRVRNTRLPVAANSLVAAVLTDMQPVRVVPGDGQWDNYLCDRLGGARPTEVFIAPLVSSGRVVAVLYGDNLPAAEPVGDTETLEIFLSQAGLVMDRTLQAGLC